MDDSISIYACCLGFAGRGDAPPDGPLSSNALTYEVAAEVCQRMGGKAILAGSIFSLGSRYIVGVKALGCGSGETLAAAQAQAENKDGVLSVIGKVATNVRAKVGESLPSREV